MKLSINWLKEFTDLDIPVDQLVEKIGAQLGAVEEVVYLGERYKGVTVAKVVSCRRHPDAEKLQVCTIDDGGKAKDVARGPGGHIEVVCGAPNVRPDIFVAWLPPGATVPNTIDKDPLRLDARDIRGVVSNGMLASGRELAINDDHEGILEIDELARPGDRFADIYKLDDYVIDIENKMFTHRPDCFGILGIAREVSGIQDRQFVSPDWYRLSGQPLGAGSGRLSVEVQVPELCPRYMAAAVSGVQVRPSPLRLQTMLKRIGIRPLNNIVDMTNYLMMLTGQPLHAFDFDKVARGGKTDIVVRTPRRGERLTLLDGKVVEPREDSVLICNHDGPLAIGGVMGGADSEISQQTTSIIIECATFNLYNIRKTSMTHGLFTDAVTRFTKGQSPLQCEPVIRQAIAMTRELCPGAVYDDELVDAGAPPSQPQPVAVSTPFINSRLGLRLEQADVTRRLANVECSVQPAEDLSGLAVTPPFWRTDLHIPEDIAEEVGRLYGYDKLHLELPRRSIEPPAAHPDIAAKDRMREVLRRHGANELLTYTFVHGDLLRRTGQDPGLAFEISNALSPDLQYYRLSLTPSLLDKVHPNIRAGHGRFAVFEINKIHMKGQQDEQEPDLPQEDSHIALVVSVDDKTAAATYGGAAYYLARSYLETLLSAVHRNLAPLSGYDLKDDGWARQMCAPYEPDRSAVIVKEGIVQGVIGEFRAPVRNALKLPPFTAGFEVSLELPASQPASPYVPLPRFPGVEQDISLRVRSDVGYGELYEFLWARTDALKPPETLASLEPLDIYQRADDTGHTQFAFRLRIASYERTLTSAEVNLLLDHAAAAAGERFGAERL